MNEDRNVWRTFLDKAVASGEETMFDMATLYAKTLVSDATRAASEVRPMSGTDVCCVSVLLPGMCV